jgi:hypothetical protein
MVTQGDFTVQIINAETNLPFKEHVHKKDGKVYVEVEPDVEYYIQIKARNTIDALVTAAVDDVNIGYNSCLPAYSESSVRLGCRNDSGDIAAFYFRKTLVQHADDVANDERTRTWTGTIQASFYKRIPNPLAKIFGPTSGGNGWHKGNVGATMGVTPLNQKKGVYSDEGESKLQRNVQWSNEYTKGEKLAEINMMYCSTVGLILFGLLPSPNAPRFTNEAEDQTGHNRATKRSRTDADPVDLTKDD